MLLKVFMMAGVFFVCKNEVQASVDLDEAEAIPQRVVPKVLGRMRL
jgi:hypothetical protein